MSLKRIKGSSINTFGYNIPKKELSNKQLEQLKGDLTVTPNTMGYSQSDDDGQYEVFIENDTHISIPRFYGVSILREPSKQTFEHIKTNIEFTGRLRDYQIDIINKSIEHMKKNGGGLISVPCGYGKCLKKGTKVLMYSGRYELVENLKIGDLLVGDDMTPRRIESLGNGIEQLYTIHNKNDFKDNYTVNESHILSLIDNETIIDINILDVIERAKKHENQYIPKDLYGYKAPAIFESKYEPIVNAFELGKNTRFIPQIYKYGSIKNRLKMLSSIIQSNSNNLIN